MASTNSSRFQICFCQRSFSLTLVQGKPSICQIHIMWIAFGFMTLPWGSSTTRLGFPWKYRSCVKNLMTAFLITSGSQTVYVPGHLCLHCLKLNSHGIGPQGCRIDDWDPYDVMCMSPQFCVGLLKYVQFHWCPGLTWVTTHFSSLTHQGGPVIVEES